MRENINNRKKDKDSDYFGINIASLTKIIEEYQSRTFNEDILNIQSLGGIESIIKSLNTDSNSGLNIDNKNDIKQRVDYFSDNRKEKLEEVSFCDLVLECLGDFMLQILIVAAIVQISIGLSPLAQSNTDWIDGMAIVFAIVIVILTSSITNYQKELKLIMPYESLTNKKQYFECFFLLLN